MILSKYKDNLPLSIFMWIAFSIGFGIAMINNRVFLIGSFSRMITSDIQSISWVFIVYLHARSDELLPG